MKRPIISSDCLKPEKDRFLNRLLRRCGAYHHSARLFYHELWKQHLAHLGWRVLSVERLPYHPVWHIRLCGNLSVQIRLLVSQPVPAKPAEAEDLVSGQLVAEVRKIAKDLGPAIRRDCLNVARRGSYFQVSFIWPLGKQGVWVKPEKKPDAFSFLVRPWLRRNRN